MVSITAWLLNKNPKKVNFLGFCFIKPLKYRIINKKIKKYFQLLQ